MKCKRGEREREVRMREDSMIAIVSSKNDP